MRPFYLVLVAILLPLWAAAANAQNVPSPYEYIESRHELGLFGGYIHIDDGEFGFGPDPAPLFGARYNIRLTGPLLGTVEVGAMPTTRTIYLPTSSATTPLREVGTDDMWLFTAEAGLLFQLTGPRTWHGLAPFVGANAGLGFDLTPGDPAEDVLTSSQLFRFGPTFAARGLAGTDFFLTEHLSVRLEGFDHLWRLNYPSGLIGATEDRPDWTHNFGVTLGTAIHF